MKRTGFLYDKRYLLHDTGPYHPERAERLQALHQGIHDAGYLSHLTHMTGSLPDMQWVQAVHTAEYIRRFEELCLGGRRTLDCEDNQMGPDTWETAKLAVGGVIEAARRIMANEIDNAFCAVRPPGHHAEAGEAMGFCYFNNVAIAACYLQKQWGIKRVGIIDFDVHHGNGTQDAFYTDPNVLYFSTHQHPLYPGTGSVHELGAKAGEGYTVNVPMLPGCGDEEYQAVFEDILAPIARRFNPELILVSAGYDAHWADTIAQMNLSVSGFARLTEILKVLANLACQDRLVLCLEGGYDLKATPLSIAATLNVLFGKKEFDDPLGQNEASSKPSNFYSHLKTVKDIHHIK